MNITNGMVAAITGGGGGIARSVARALAAKGCHIALADVNEPALRDNVAALAATGVKVSRHRVDVTRGEDLERFAAEAVAEHGKVNILDNNAGITLQKSFETHSLADWEHVYGINIMGVIHGCRAFLPALREAARTEGAHIINMSSMAGFVGIPMQASYSSTKAAVRALSETLYAELHRDGIGVTSVHPGAIKTRMILATLAESDDPDAAERSYRMVEKMGRSPEYAARRIVRAIEKGRPRLRIGADALILDLLQRAFPAGLVRLLPKLAARART